MGRRLWDYFLLLITAATFMTFLGLGVFFVEFFVLFFLKLTGIAFPTVEEYSGSVGSVVVQGKSYVREIRQLDAEEEHVHTSLP